MHFRGHPFTRTQPWLLVSKFFPHMSTFHYRSLMFLKIFSMVSDLLNLVQLTFFAFCRQKSQQFCQVKIADIFNCYTMHIVKVNSNYFIIVSKFSYLKVSSFLSPLEPLSFTTKKPETQI